jgi:hypothetical protein
MDTVSRRLLLRLAVLGAGVVAMPAGAARAGGVFGAGPTWLRRSVFTRHTGTTFRLDGGGRVHRAVLHSVGGLDGHPADSRFSLLFRMRGRMPEGIYAVSNPALSAVSLFLTPVGHQPGWYEAVVDAA